MAKLVAPEVSLDSFDSPFDWQLLIATTSILRDPEGEGVDELPRAGGPRRILWASLVHGRKTSTNLSWLELELVLELELELELVAGQFQFQFHTSSGENNVPNSGFKLVELFVGTWRCN